MPKVSVIIPTHNRAELLRSAITSVLNQTFQDFEIIVIDDASKDHTREVIGHFNDARIKVIHNQVSKGAAGARNIGIMNTNCEYIAFLDDDDEWLRDEHEIQYCLLDDRPPEVGCICTGCFIIEKMSGRVSIYIPGIYDLSIIEKMSGRVSIYIPGIYDLSKDNFIATSTVL